MKNRKSQLPPSGHSKFDGYIKYRNTSILFCIAVIIIFLLFFRNNLNETVYVEPQADALFLSSYKGDELSISYKDITSVELTDSFDFGTMQHGTDNFRTRCGTWSNKTLGSYHLFTLNKAVDYIILTTDTSTVVFNYESTDVTESLYTALKDLLEEKGLADQISFNSDLGTPST